MSKVAFAGTSDPTKKLISFVLTDFEPNKNGIVIPEEEIKNIIETAKYKPVKVYFDGERVGGHESATPIGVISDVVIDDQDRIIASAVLWSQENNEFIRWMEKRLDSVFFSWEVVYNQELQNEPGLKELRNVFISGVAIVENPAYGKRTKLIYFAEEQPKELLMPQETDKDLSETTKVPEMAQEPKEDAQPQFGATFSTDTSDASKNEGTPAQQETKISEQELAELHTLREFYRKYQEEQRRQEMSAERKSQLSDDSLFLAYEHFILSLSEEQFLQFVDIVKALKTRVETSESKSPSQQPVIPLAAANTDYKQDLIRIVKSLR